MKEDGTIIIALIVMFVLAVGAIAFEIWIWNTYGNMAWEDIPTWVKYFMLNRN